MKRKNSGGRTAFTALLLLALVAAAAWTLKIGSARTEELGTVKIEPPADRLPAAEAADPTVEKAEKSEPVTEEPKPEPEEAAREAAAEEEALRAEQERAAFLPDYESYPLLNTTPIIQLSMEVGATEEEVRFNWMSPSGKKGKVSWNNTDTGEKQIFEAECTASSTVPGYYVNKASVSRIQPGMHYTYQVGNDDAWSPEYPYTAPEDQGNAFTFIVTSDAQIGQAQHESMSRTIETWDKVVTRLKTYIPEAQFMFHLGDQVAVYGSLEEYEGFLDHLSLYQIPLAPVTGNHDVPNEKAMEHLGMPGAPYFYERFNVPNRSEEYGFSQYDKDGDYYFICKDVLFIVLNSSTIQLTDTHEAYVKQVVEAHPDTKWRIIAQHYPAYSSVQKYQENLDPWTRVSLGYIADDNDIDLILTGHDHAYSRSAFTDRERVPYTEYDYSSGAVAVNPKGTMYVTCGTGSGCVYQPITPEKRIVFQGQPEVPSALRIDVTDTDLHIRCYLADSWTVYDEYTIRKE